MEQSNQRQSYVNFETYADGRVRVHIAGQNGQSLSLEIDTTHEEPVAMIPLPFAGKGLYRAVVGVQANGHLKGWLVDQQNDQVVWFPQRAKPKRAKHRAGDTRKQE